MRRSGLWGKNSVIIKSANKRHADIRPESKLYRIVPLDRLCRLFEDQRNGLVRPSRWEDPFENLALKSRAIIGGEEGEFSFRDELYAQCWTQHTASDAMWRIYGQSRKEVRIRTNVQKLLSSVEGSPNYEAGQDRVFIGKVQYCSDSDLVKFSKTHFASGFDSDGENVASSLLIKRNAFSHEKEVRLVFWRGRKCSSDLLLYECDPHKLIDQIMLHPMMSAEDAAYLKSQIIEKTKFKGEILRSKLYSLPSGFKFVVGP
ncbi:MAG: hypothetical protein CVT79_12560 [Alphaproteobacteria bacterium HGW-Alphaproteobacteria-18]|nr:MAG: hypothetical protein CVT79_12560 [Alphaproteobacteria bacterium HGW-Alphaproteobacteria-18]